MTPEFADNLVPSRELFERIGVTISMLFYGNKIQLDESRDIYNIHPSLFIPVAVILRHHCVVHSHLGNSRRFSCMVWELQVKKYPTYNHRDRRVELLDFGLMYALSVLYRLFDSESRIMDNWITRSLSALIHRLWCLSYRHIQGGTSPSPTSLSSLSLDKIGSDIANSLQAPSTTEDNATNDSGRK
ncbi:hypothetical protein AGABI1DRAFT_130811 [Agaricus bisporus var. burnettii JB137-S8]|uniref:Uncharacterized protein n=1 Tax=Agaricus bisporus var. burnettii (strain JB137-S8 / ATCC MYA-4627 / FGSC 10392) TaxID=597362 RepID=K5X1U9_AGABU|nr:uncharacterized protein AGABI1DRAFT_130811 [Agaricus bisporus var. burnettii JB137-S8]EKM77088.1 hypothetical protein AGABI1DRAFT_130811 [Agaricus bisporus var. burnettii JB137-S8]